MMRGLLVAIASLWLLLVLAHHGEGRLLQNSMDNSEAAQAAAAGTSSIELEPHRTAAPAPESGPWEPITCVWTCYDVDYDCECVPVSSDQDYLLQMEDNTTDSASATE